MQLDSQYSVDGFPSIVCWLLERRLEPDCIHDSAQLLKGPVPPCLCCDFSHSYVNDRVSGTDVRDSALGIHARTCGSASVLGNTVRWLAYPGNGENAI